MEATQDNAGPTGQGPSHNAWWPSNFMERLRTVSLFSSEEAVNSKETSSGKTIEGLASHRASQILWASGQLSEPIPNGFYSVVLVSSALVEVCK